MTEDRNTATAQRGPRTNAEVLERVLQTARSDDYEGYSKHDGLNSPLLAALGGQSRLRRLAAIQVVTRSPIDIRPLAGVRKARNAKGLSLFSRALLARHRMTGSADDAAQARGLLDWLIAHPAPGFEHLCWGYPYPWQDVGFFAPRNFPNRVVTSFVGQALLDGYETLQDSRYLDAARQAARFLLEAPKTLYEDPPSASHITHDNYHTGFILDAILGYGLATGSDEFEPAYQRGIEFYARKLFEPDGAARFMSDRLYPIDIHGCAQGVITFSLQQRCLGAGGDTAARVLQWTLDNMWDPGSGWFYYQRRRRYRTRIRELRWCQGWMSWALASYLENCGGQA